jgi:hypothetical protein
VEGVVDGVGLEGRPRFLGVVVGDGDKDISFFCVLSFFTFLAFFEFSKFPCGRSINR